MVDVDTLEVLVEPRQTSQSAVTDGPVWQHPAQCREYRERIATHRGISLEEGRNHDIAAILVNRCAGSIKLSASQSRTSRINSSGILRLYPISETSQRVDKLLEGLAAITRIGIAHSLESRTQRDGSHLEGSTLGGWRSFIHILYALLRGLGTCGREINLEILDRLQGGTQRKIIRSAGSSRCCDTVVAEQPVVVSSLLDIIVANHTEGKVKTRCHLSHLLLSEGITHTRQEARQGELIAAAIVDAHIAHHHCQTTSQLQSLIPFLIIKRFLSQYGEFHLHGSIYL